MRNSSKCPLCHGRGIIIKDNIAYKCNCVKQEQYNKKFKRANLAGILQKQRFDNFDFKYYPEKYCEETHCTYHQAAQKAFLAAQNFCRAMEQGKKNMKGIMFCGPVGSGKTFLAACIANRLLENGIEILFTVVPDLLDIIKSTYDFSHLPDHDREINILDSARNVPLLILDDLGVHNYTTWTKNKIYSIINYRVNMELPTIITTNEEMETLEIYLGDRTTSRISQLCNIYMMYTPTDIRLVKNKEENKSFTSA